MSDDPYNLTRFLDAQEGVFEDVLTELGDGKKRTHWMWFVFPQIDGLGKSAMSKHYSIKSREEAQEYINHPILGERLSKCAALLLDADNRSAREIFGSPDDQKLQSSMTLFASVTDSDSIFVRVLDKYFDGKRDENTTSLVGDSPAQ